MRLMYIVPIALGSIAMFFLFGGSIYNIIVNISRLPRTEGLFYLPHDLDHMKLFIENKTTVVQLRINGGE